MGSDRRLPDATVSRLPVYLQVLVEAAEGGRETLSSDELATAAGLTSAKVRKDLSLLGSYGTRGVGYDIAELTDEISAVLGLDVDRPVVIVGVGNLGSALANYDGFTRRGFTVAALLDADPAKTGMLVGGHRVQPADAMRRIVTENDVTIAVLATPARYAQHVAEELVEAGVTAILNFAPVHIELPEHVSVRTVDLSTELQILSFYEQLSSQLPTIATG